MLVVHRMWRLRNFTNSIRSVDWGERGRSLLNRPVADVARMIGIGGIAGATAYWLYNQYSNQLQPQPEPVPDPDPDPGPKMSLATKNIIMKHRRRHHHHHYDLPASEASSERELRVVEYDEYPPREPQHDTDTAAETCSLPAQYYLHDFYVSVLGDEYSAARLHRSSGVLEQEKPSDLPSTSQPAPEQEALPKPEETQDRASEEKRLSRRQRKEDKKHPRL
ncbi:uncharacterized protein [Periplaneta americana]|uniref:uncharacterized protein n=1 Tax=Periplaneta americana TaxID=6978 RepID=UPI0037E8AB6B